MAPYDDLTAKHPTSRGERYRYQIIEPFQQELQWSSCWSGLSSRAKPEGADHARWPEYRAVQRIYVRLRGTIEI